MALTLDTINYSTKRPRRLYLIVALPKSTCVPSSHQFSLCPSRGLTMISAWTWNRFCLQKGSLLDRPVSRKCDTINRSSDLMWRLNQFPKPADVCASSSICVKLRRTSLGAQAYEEKASDESMFVHTQWLSIDVICVRATTVLLLSPPFLLLFFVFHSW